MPNPNEPNPDERSPNPPNPEERKPIPLNNAGPPVASAAGLRLVVLVCTYNEIENLPNLVQSIQRYVPEGDILIVDDNSPDGTGEWARQQAEQNSPDRPKRIGCIIREGKLGLGSAIREGMQEALRRGYDIVVNMDADFSHDPERIPVMLARLLGQDDHREQCDVVIGSRYVAGGQISGLSLARRSMSIAINRYASTLLRVRIGDWSSSFRAYRATKLRELDWAQLQCSGYGSLQEILWHLNRCGSKIREIPIHYINRTLGKSKISVQDATGALRTIHRLAYRGLKPRQR